MTGGNYARNFLDITNMNNTYLNRDLLTYDTLRGVERRPGLQVAAPCQQPRGAHQCEQDGGRVIVRRGQATYDQS